MTPTRRDLLKFAGGAATGALFTPAPWRLVTDTALWSETWPGVPRPARGEIRARFTNCSLCTAGCAVRARCVGDQPVALMGVAEHPFTRGALCPFGIAGHHLPYQPGRIKQGPEQQARDAIASAIAKCTAGERIAVLDLRPGRTASWTYRRALAQWKGGTYLAAPRPLGGGLAVNLAAAKTVLSVGVPLLDGWGTPGNVMAARNGFRLVQVEAVESRTAALADLWVPVEPGKELDAARRIALAEPALVVDAQERPEILELNRSLGHTIVARREAPVPAEWRNVVAETALDAVPDGSIRVLLIDESAPGTYIPWTALEKKLVTQGAIVAAFGSSREGYGRHAQFLLPTAVFPEALDDIPPAVDSPEAMFRLSAALVPPPAGVVNPADFIAGLAGIDAGNALRERADAIHRAARGTLFTYADAKSTPISEVTADAFWKALNEGASWTDAPAESPGTPTLPARADAPSQTESDLPLAVVITGASGAGSPILSKLYRESNLLLSANDAVLHPDAARQCGVEDGGKAILETRCGRMEVKVSCDWGLPPGVVQVAAAPPMLDLCGTSPRAKVVRV